MRPILAVDVDGVICPFGFDEPPAGATRIDAVGGAVHYVSLAAGERLRRLAEGYELLWATGWEEEANRHLAAPLGLPELPYLTFGGKARFGSAHWKLGPLEEYSRGRGLAWVDDSFDESCYEWARQREAPTLLVPVDPAVGLDEAQFEALRAWANGGA